MKLCLLDSNHINTSKSLHMQYAILSLHLIYQDAFLSLSTFYTMEWGHDNPAGFIPLTG